jgi:predicted dehydrogenase
MKCKIGIIGTGRIVPKMASTLQKMEGIELYAIASRTELKAKTFAEQWGFQRYYGSYEAMLEDENVQLVYIATPHSEHYANAKACLLKGKAVLCEKAFTVDARQAEELFRISKEKKVFIAEAIWTRYMPSREIINEIIRSGVIGTPKMLSANLGYPVWEKERLQKPELGGGALLDMGVYPLNFALMCFGKDIRQIISGANLAATGVDEQASVTLMYNDNRMAILHCTMLAKTDREGVIAGTKGHIIVQNINNPEKITVIDANNQVQSVHDVPQQITGFEYQVYAAIEAISKGEIESPYMPHEESLYIMHIMDNLRKEWGVVYPSDAKLIS